MSFTLFVLTGAGCFIWANLSNQLGLAIGVIITVLFSLPSAFLVMYSYKKPLAYQMSIKRMRV